MRHVPTSIASLLVLLLQACGSDDAAVSPAPGAVADPQVTIVSPVDGATITSLPASLTVQLRNVDPSAMRVLLSGVDITTTFGAADASGTRSAMVTMPALNPGRNQLQVTAAGARADATFTLDLSGASVPGAAALPLLVPIRTRVLCDGCDGSSETHYGVEIRKDAADPSRTTVVTAPPLPAGSAPNQGFHVLFLNRVDLSVVSNASVANPATASWTKSALMLALTGEPPAGCGGPAPGCVLVVQSLGRIGYTPCFAGGSPADCSDSSALLQTAGASGRLTYANGANPQVAFSYIGNISAGPFGVAVPVSAGSNHERLHCAGGSTGAACDNLGSPGLAGTAAAGATPAQIGALAGVLVRDNHYHYTFAQNAPLLQFSSVYDADNVSHGFTIDGRTIWSGFASVWPQQGGLHVVVVDSRDPRNVVENQWYPASPCANQLYGADGRGGAGALIGRYASPAYLVFVATFGDTRYDPLAVQCNYEGAVAPNNARADTARFAALLDRLGGTWQVFFLNNFPNTGYPGNAGFADYQDEYTLVGAFRDAVFTGLEGQRGAELSSVIARETMRYPRPPRIEGVLALGNQGTYRPQLATHNLGLFNPNLLAVATASRLNPVPWPLPGDTAPAAAYAWVSGRLCCRDLRAAYLNQNVDPGVWLQQLRRLVYADAGPAPAFSQEDFVAVQQQLGVELEYLIVVRRLQANIVQLYQQRQAAVPLLLIQAQDQVLRDLQVDLNTKVKQPKWASITNSVLGVLGGVSTIAGLAGAEAGGPIIATGLKTALALGQLGVTIAADETTKAAGTSLQAEENLEVAAAQVAARAADTFSANLGQVAAQFDRVVSDWGRLRAVGGPLVAGLVPWDNSASFLLMKAYDRVIRREFYTTLLQANTQITVFGPASAGPRNTNTWHRTQDTAVCRYDETTINPYYGRVFSGSGSGAQQLPMLFYPSGQPNRILGTSNRFPNDYEWSVWVLVLAKNASDLCPFSDPLPGTYGLFDPLDPDDDTALGSYRLWWFTRNPGFTVYAPPDYDHGGEWGSCDRPSDSGDCSDPIPPYSLGLPP